MLSVSADFFCGDGARVATDNDDAGALSFEFMGGCQADATVASRADRCFVL
jgi:hypothetical protein